jgi:hypothetical protein
VRAAYPPALSSSQTSWRAAARLCRLLCLLLAFVPSAFAEEADEEEDLPWWDYAATQSHSFLSQRLETTTRRLDEFFGGERAQEESGASRLTLGAGVELNEGMDLRFVSRFRIHVNLPATRQRFKLLIESDVDEDLEDNGVDVVSALKTQAERENYNTALRLVFAAIGGWHASTDAGIRLNIPPDPFVRLRVRRSFEISTWLLRITERVFWFNSRGFGATTNVEFDRPFSDDELFRLASEATWLLDEDGFALAQSATFFHHLRGGHGLVYQASLAGETSPRIQTVDYEISMRYRKSLFWDWFFLEIAPAVHWPREDHFKPVSAILFRVEAIFGGDYLPRLR